MIRSRVMEPDNSTTQLFFYQTPGIPTARCYRHAQMTSDAGVQHMNIQFTNIR
jgi:hypothetical protein